MLLHPPPGAFQAACRIAIFAAVDAGVIHPNIYALNTAAFPPLSRIFLKIQLIADQIVDLFFVNTGSMLNSQSAQVHLFRTGIERQAIFFANPRQSFRQSHYILRLHLQVRGCPYRNR